MDELITKYVEIIAFIYNKDSVDHIERSIRHYLGYGYHFKEALRATIKDCEENNNIY